MALLPTPALPTSNSTGVGTTMAMTATGAAAVGVLTFFSKQYGHPIPADIALDLVVLASGAVHWLTGLRKAQTPKPSDVPTTATPSTQEHVP